jgi:hypothetical protein
MSGGCKVTREHFDAEDSAGAQFSDFSFGNMSDLSLLCLHSPVHSVYKAVVRGDLSSRVSRLTALLLDLVLPLSSDGFTSGPVRSVPFGFGLFSFRDFRVSGSRSNLNNEYLM